MSDYSNSVMIAYPVAWPTKPEPAVTDIHSTILYLGETSELSYGPMDVMDVLREHEHNVFIWANVVEAMHFGIDQDVPVLRIEHTFLNEYYNDVVPDLAERGIVSASEFPYNPHVTIDENTFDNGPIPNRLMLRPVRLWWGSTQYSFDKG